MKPRDYLTYWLQVNVGGTFGSFVIYCTRTFARDRADPSTLQLCLIQLTNGSTTDV